MTTLFNIDIQEYFASIKNYMEGSSGSNRSRGAMKSKPEDDKIIISSSLLKKILLTFIATFIIGMVVYFRESIAGIFKSTSKTELSLKGKK